MTSLPQIRLDPESPEPMYRQLYNGVRRAVLNRTLAPGTRLPATRELARDLGVARNTVMLAFDQLIAEGYLEGRVGAGTYVTSALPDERLSARAPERRAPKRIDGRALSDRGRKLAKTRVTLNAPAAGVRRAFRMGMPALDAFPFAEWSRITSKFWRKPSPDLLFYGDPAGYEPLREQIATYLGAARAVQCDASQVIVISGSQQALELSARLLVDPGDAVWIEDPGYLGARAALAASEARVVPVPVDAEGIDVDAGVRLCADARVAYVTPSHQFPLSVTMSLARRLALLDWAARADAWILEDDFDSEYRYAGRPLASLQGLDGYGRVIYIGTFSKVMFPSLRIGYMVVPPDLVDAFVAARAIVDRHPPTVEQAALAQFMADGHLARHIRRMRMLYEERQQMLLDAGRRELRGLIDLQPADTGMHVVGWLPAGADDAEIARRCSAAGVEAAALSAYCLDAQLPPALTLGYAACDERTIREGAGALAGVLASRR
jgi:GntR family transcriptional regulator/MocR family aminotransferase